MRTYSQKANMLGDSRLDSSTVYLPIYSHIVFPLSGDRWCILHAHYHQLFALLIYYLSQAEPTHS
jgi:hypothetical protein